MSGGSMEYISYTLEQQKGCFRGDRSEAFLEDALIEFCELLHAREWYLSGDTCEGEWNNARDIFMYKYEKGYNRPNYCYDCTHWRQETGVYGKCEYEKRCLLHRCENVCERFDDVVAKMENEDEL